ncbi:MAG TPA: hypothetical protein PK156_16145 [Polyangium sp.]|nr:hypothetical protein [Polyangium sp.]
MRIALGLFCLLVAIDCVWLGMWPRFGEIHWGAFVVTGVIAAIFFWLSWDAFSHYARARRQRVVQHEFGLRIHEAQRIRDIRFDDVTSIGGVLWQTPPEMPPRGAILWIDDVHEQRFELPSPHAKAEELGESIRNRTFDKRRAAAELGLAQNEDVRFGRLVLSSLALIVQGEVIPRSAIESATLSARWLTFNIAGQRNRMVATEEIPDCDVLLALLRH